MSFDPPPYAPSSDTAASARDPILVRLSPQERYERDPEFRHVVDVLEFAIARLQLTPTEVREATILACIRHELRSPRLAVSFRSGDTTLRGVVGVCEDCGHSFPLSSDIRALADQVGPFTCPQCRRGATKEPR
jgi:hypothetical protein